MDIDVEFISLYITTPRSLKTRKTKVRKVESYSLNQMIIVSLTTSISSGKCSYKMLEQTSHVEYVWPCSCFLKGNEFIGIFFPFFFSFRFLYRKSWWIYLQRKEPKSLNDDKTAVHGALWDWASQIQEWTIYFPTVRWIYYTGPHWGPWNVGELSTFRLIISWPGKIQTISLWLSVFGRPLGDY